MVSDDSTAGENIREANLDDLGQIKGIISASSVFTADEEHEILNCVEHYAQEPDGDEFLTYVYAVDGIIAGFISLGLGLGNKTYEVYWICVSPVHQGKGVGTKLLTFAENYAMRAEARILFVETSSKKEYGRARTLYEHGGYALSAVVRDYFDDGDDKVIYAKKLSSRPSAS